MFLLVDLVVKECGECDCVGEWNVVYLLVFFFFVMDIGWEMVFGKFVVVMLIDVLVVLNSLIIVVVFSRILVISMM